MYPSLRKKLERFEELERRLREPDAAADQERYVAAVREYGALAKIAGPLREFDQLQEEIQTARTLLKEEHDPESQAYARRELESLLAREAELKKQLEDLATAGDELTRDSLIMEIRPGTGGDEAALFARDLFEMYRRFCERRGWKLEVIEFQPTELGGLREVIFSVTGPGAYHQCQFESGVHRVQRVPETEAQGRIHTSTATVAVLPEATEVEVELKPEDLRIDIFRAGGPGGQKVNKTESAIRITHLPTGIVVQCQDEVSQHKNKAKAMRVLRSRLLEAKQRAASEARASERRTLIGSGDRSERIRTYNFPQNRVTDHRIGLTLYKLDRIMQGELDELIDALVEFDRQERLEGQQAQTS